MVDHTEVTPDYYIDKSKGAVFIPQANGHDKSTYLENKPGELFDFNSEAEPIL